MGNITISRKEIEQFDARYRVNLINHLAGVKTAHLIGTKSVDGVSNLAIFNSICHVGANPAVMGFLMRPLTVERHTYTNIIQTNSFTINHFSTQHIEAAHMSSAKYPKNVSEFDHLPFTPFFYKGFEAPFVKESFLQIGLRLEETHEIACNKTIFIVGRIECIHLGQELIEDTGHIRFGNETGVCVSGLDTYYKVKKQTRKGYARFSE